MTIWDEGQRHDRRLAGPISKESYRDVAGLGQAELQCRVSLR